MRSKITPHFTYREMTQTSTGLPNVPDKTAQVHLVYLCRALERVRDKLNRGNLVDPIPIIINSAFRTREVNSAVGGSPSSYHLDGRACDIDISYMSDDVLDKLIEALYDEFPSEIYTNVDKKYIHFAI